MVDSERRERLNRGEGDGSERNRKREIEGGRGKEIDIVIARGSA